MSEKINRLRSWLERNKIFFDITATLLLALMTVTVSISANAIAKNQNNLMKEENQPIFRFNLTEDYKDKNNSEFGALEALEIYNDGESINRFSATSVAFLEMSYTCYKDTYTGDNMGTNYIKNTNIYNIYTDDGYIQKYACVPIDNYYTISNDTSSTTGLLTTLYRPNPTQTEEAIFNDINKSDRSTLYDSNVSTILNTINDDYCNCLNNQNNYNEYGGVDLHLYVYIIYLDIYGERHDDVYWVNNMGWGKLCEKDKITLIKKHHQPNLIPYPYFTYIPPTKIIKTLSESSSTQDDLPGSSWLFDSQLKFQDVFFL